MATLDYIFDDERLTFRQKVERVMQSPDIDEQGEIVEWVCRQHDKHGHEPEKEVMG